MVPIALLLHPELRAVPAERRGDLLRAARRLPFDILELLGMATGLIVAGLFMQYAVQSWTSPVAAPVLALTVGPFLMRRTRRGLRQAMARAPR